jgi:CheY-like chemotaxis protein
MRATVHARTVAAHGARPTLALRAQSASNRRVRVRSRRVRIIARSIGNAQNSTMSPATPSNASLVRVVVVDDNPRFRAVAAEVVAATAGFVVVGSAGSGEEALAALERLRPDLVLMDVRLPGIDGVEAARAAARLPFPPVVALLSADERPEIAEDPRSHGATAFVHKQRFSPRMLRALWAPAAADPAAA